MRNKLKKRLVTPKNKKKKIPFIVVCAFFALIILFGLITTQATKENKQNNEETKMTQSKAGFKTFTSQSLGISFDYATQENTPVKVFVKQIDNRVYLYSNLSKDPTTGKFVEVFSKNPSDSLSQAIEKQFLKNYSLTKCPIIEAQLPNGYRNPARQYIQMTTPILSGSMAEKLAAEKRCPPVYTYNRRAGVVYFMMDEKHPDKFFFFRIGQDNIGGTPPNDKGVGQWDQTLTIDTKRYKTKYTYHVIVEKNAPPRKALGLKPSDTGKTYNIPLNTSIFLECSECINGYTIEIQPQKGIIEPPQRKKNELLSSLGFNTIALLKAVGEGQATINLLIQ